MAYFLSGGGGMNAETEEKIDAIYNATVIHTGDMVELWKNPNTSTGFATQKIEMDLSKYHYIVVKAKSDSSVVDDKDVSSYDMSQIFIIKGGASVAMMNQNQLSGSVQSRTAKATDDGVFFGVGVQNAAYPIPIAIYGIEKVE